MTQGKPAERILSEITRVGSSLAELATSELDVVLNELRGPAGATSPLDADIGRERVNVGTLALNALQLLSKVGDMMSQLSKYDLVRNDTSQLLLRSANPVSSLTLQVGESCEYAILLENDGTKSEQVKLSAILLGEPAVTLEVVPPVDRIEAGERRRVSVKLPPQSVAGTQQLRLEVSDASAQPVAAHGAERQRKEDAESPKVLARKTVQVIVRPTVGAAEQEPRRQR